LKKAKPADLAGYDTVVVGGSIKVGKFDAFNWLSKNRSTLALKNVHLFTVSGAGADGEGSERFRAAAMPDWLEGSASYHAFPGRWDPADAPSFLRWMFNQAAKKEANGGPMTEMATAFDRMDESSINPLLELLK
jgi:hypothetical protein